MEALKITGEGRPLIEATRYLYVEDGPVLDKKHSRTGKKYRVVQVVVPYKWTPDRWRTTVVNLIGPVLRKDGSDGATQERAFVSNYEREQPGWEWLNEIIDAARPVGTLDLPQLPATVQGPGDGA